MATDLVVEALLPKLTPEQIDWLWTNNRRTSQYISKHRTELPGTIVDCLTVCNLVLVSKKGVLKLLNIDEASSAFSQISHLRPKQLHQWSDCLISYMDAGFLEHVEDASFSRTLDEKDFRSFFSNLKNCTNVSMTHDPRPYDSDLVLTGMSAVSQLRLGSCKYSSSFLENLSRKSHNGPGISMICLQNQEGDGIDSRHLLDFMHTAKFDPNSRLVLLRFKKVIGDRIDFIQNLLHIKESLGWRDVHSDPESISIRINTQTEIITLIIDDFFSTETKVW